MAVVLVVEDEDEIREDICTILELEGYETDNAENGIMALERLKAQSSDLILCDIYMPQMNGYEFLKTLQATPDYARIPFVFMSAKAGTQDDAEKMRGSSAYLKKPFPTESLLETIARLLNAL